MFIKLNNAAKNNPILKETKEGLSNNIGCESTTDRTYESLKRGGVTPQTMAQTTPAHQVPTIALEK